MRKGILVIILVGLISFFLSGCKKKGHKSFLSFGQGKKLEVSVWKVKKIKRVPLVLEYPGKTRSFKKVIVRARISGILEKILFKEGSFVRKGKLLFLIERAIYQAKYDSAKAGFLQARAQYFSAKRTWLRIKKAFEKGAVSPEQRDRTLAQYKLANATLALAKARLRQAKIFLDYTRVTAPISGIISEKKVSAGNLVSPGMPLVEIDRINPIYVYFSIPDEDLLKYGLLNKKSFNYIKRLKVRLKLENRIYPFKGRINYVEPVLSASTGTLKVRAIFPNPHREIPANLFVRVELLGVKVKNAYLIPKKSVLWSPEGEKIYLIKDGKVFEKFIKIIGEWKNYYIIKEGLHSGDEIAVDNLLKLKPGASVKIIKVIEK